MRTSMCTLHLYPFFFLLSVLVLFFKKNNLNGLQAEITIIASYTMLLPSLLQYSWPFVNVNNHTILTIVVMYNSV